MKKLSYSLIGLAFVATAAHAQQPAETPAPAQEAAAPSADAAEGAYTDDQIDSFAKATIKLHAINGDASLDATQKQTQMAEVVTASGLDAETYNAIGQAAQDDPALLAKVQSAMAQHAQPSEG